MQREQETKTATDRKKTKKKLFVLQGEEPTLRPFILTWYSKDVFKNPYVYTT